jgi:hypothetical protein
MPATMTVASMSEPYDASRRRGRTRPSSIQCLATPRSGRGGSTGGACHTGSMSAHRSCRGLSISACEGVPSRLGVCGGSRRLRPAVRVKGGPRRQPYVPADERFWDTRSWPSGRPDQAAPTWPTCSSNVQQRPRWQMLKLVAVRGTVSVKTAQRQSNRHFASRGLGVRVPLAPPQVTGPFSLR